MAEGHLMAMEPVTELERPDLERPALDGRDQDLIEDGRGPQAAIRHIRAGLGEPEPAGASQPSAVKQPRTAASGKQRAHPSVRGGGIWHPRLPGRKPPKLIRGPGV